MTTPSAPRGVPLATGVELSQRLDRTAGRIVAGTWGCAVITMAASAANAALTYGALGDNRVLGLATGVAVDIGLCVALIGDRRLYAHGLSSHWGRVLRITTAVMSLILNVGISLREGHYFAALLHSFLPVLLIVLCEYGQDVLLKFTALRAEREAAQQPLLPPAPVTEAFPQLHRPVASAPATTGPAEQPASASPAPSAVGAVAAQQAPLATRAPNPAGCSSTSMGFTPAGPAGSGQLDPLVSRVRALIAESGTRPPGRRAVARELGVTEHQARMALDQLAASGSPVSLNGHRGEPAGAGGSGGR